MMFTQLRKIPEFDVLSDQELHELVSSQKLLGEIIEVVDLVIMEDRSIITGDSFSLIHTHMEHQMTYIFECSRRVLYLAVIY